MPRNTRWIKRKYALMNHHPKNLCQIYKIQLFERHKGEQNSLCGTPTLENTSQPIRVDKNNTTKQIPVWAEVNERQEFGYTVQPQVESPVSYFNDQEQNDFSSFESKMNGKFYNWQQADTNEDWIQYQY